MSTEACPVLSPRVETAPEPRVTVGAACSLYIDMPPDDPDIGSGDWIVTAAGSRYLVTAARLVRTR